MLPNGLEIQTYKLEKILKVLSCRGIRRLFTQTVVSLSLLRLYFNVNYSLSAILYSRIAHIIIYIMLPVLTTFVSMESGMVLEWTY